MILIYLDPGAGSIIMQLILAVFLGIGVFFNYLRQFFVKLSSLFKDKRKK
jgi:hypothetical protein